MNRLKLIIASITLALCAVSCAHKVTQEEIQAKAAQSANNGRSRFYEELAQRNVVWYASGGGSSSGFNAETGLPEVPVSSLPAGMQSADFVKAHNDAVLDYIRTNGSIPGSFLAWENDIFHQSSFWARQSNQEAQTLKLDSQVMSADYTLTLQKAGTGASAFQLVVQGPSGQTRAQSPAGATEPSVDVVFGPTGSDLLFTRWSAGGGQVIYAAMNLRDGKWLAVQQGQQ
jgi:hypothetical protein